MTTTDTHVYFWRGTNLLGKVLMNVREMVK